MKSAKTLYNETYKTTLWKEKKSSSPLLEGYLIQNKISFLDWILCQKLLEKHPQLSPEVSFFLIHLIMASREGHLCIKKENSKIYPDVNSLWQMPEEPKILEEFILKGINDLPLELMTIIHSRDQKVKTPLCTYQNCFYLQRNWIYETKFIQALKKHTSISIITGGPGTGKTYTAGKIIKENSQKKIILTAPTGKAVANLQKMTSFGENITIKTLHSLLEMTKNSSPIIVADLIIVDECSMIDIKLMGRFFESIKPGTRIILLGDPYQLPAVESGSAFADLIKIAEKLSIPCTHLTKCMRTELSSIVEFASNIKEGNSSIFMKSWEGIKQYPLELPFLNRLKGEFPSIQKNLDSIESLLEKFHSFRILSPMRKGVYGVEWMNKMLRDHFLKSQEAGWLPIPIMIVTNDYKRNLFNGETGILMKKMPFGSFEEDFAIFPSKNGTENFKLSAALLPKYEFAYSISIHKSQGSEFDRVAIVMPEGSEVFGREIFYTGVTRAKRQVEIYGSKEVIAKTIEKKAIRYSGIENENFVK